MALNRPSRWPSRASLIEKRAQMPSPTILLPVQSSQRGGEARETDSIQYIVSNNNRWSRVILNFDAVESDTWCEFDFQLEWHPQEENRTAHDFAIIGIEFLT